MGDRVKELQPEFSSFAEFPAELNHLAVVDQMSHFAGPSPEMRLFGSTLLSLQ